MKFNRLIPELNVLNIQKSIEFYVRVLGFKIEYQRKKEKFVFLSKEGSQIMLEQGNDKGFLGRGINFSIEVSDLDGLVRNLKKKKYPLLKMPEERWFKCGKRMCWQKQFLVKDPDGYLLRFTRQIRRKK